MHYVCVCIRNGSPAFLLKKLKLKEKSVYWCGFLVLDVVIARLLIMISVMVHP
jgi:flagellar biosynthesis protein FliP